MNFKNWFIPAAEFDEPLSNRWRHLVDDFVKKKLSLGQQSDAANEMNQIQRLNWIQPFLDKTYSFVRGVIAHSIIRYTQVNAEPKDQSMDCDSGK